MKIVVLGAGQVGATIVEALHDDHEVTVIDLDAARLQALSYRLRRPHRAGERGDAARAPGRRASSNAELMIACTSRDEINLVAWMLVKKLSEAQTIVRTSNPEYLEAWQERQIDVDFMVSSELETAHAVSRTIGVPAAKQTDVFADGQVQIVEFESREGSAGSPQADAFKEVVGLQLKEAEIPADSKVASIIRGDRVLVPRGDESILPGDRIIVIGSPDAAREWSRIMAQRASARRRRRHLRRGGDRRSPSRTSSSSSRSASG